MRVEAEAVKREWAVVAVPIPVPPPLVGEDDIA
jgi:hypothetical protein